MRIALDLWYDLGSELWFDYFFAEIVVASIAVILWLFACAFLGQAVMFAQNGHKVLRMMASAAAGTRRPHVDARRLSLTLPWLLAYDRRDVVSIFQIFRYLERRMASPLADEIFLMRPL